MLLSPMMNIPLFQDQLKKDLNDEKIVKCYNLFVVVIFEMSQFWGSFIYNWKCEWKGEKRFWKLQTLWILREIVLVWLQNILKTIFTN